VNPSGSARSRHTYTCSTPRRACARAINSRMTHRRSSLQEGRRQCYCRQRLFVRPPP
jgi:hypothetical protein